MTSKPRPDTPTGHAASGASAPGVASSDGEISRRTLDRMIAHVKAAKIQPDYTGAFTGTFDPSHTMVAASIEADWQEMRKRSQGLRRWWALRSWVRRYQVTISWTMLLLGALTVWAGVFVAIGASRMAGLAFIAAGGAMFMLWLSILRWAKVL